MRAVPDWDWDQLSDDALALAIASLWASTPSGMPDWHCVTMDVIARVESYAELKRRGWTPPQPDA